MTADAPNRAATRGAGTATRPMQMTGTVTSSPPRAYEIPRSPRIEREERPDREELHPHAEAGDEEPGQDDSLTLVSSDPINAHRVSRCGVPSHDAERESTASERPYHAPRANDPSGEDERRRAVRRPIGASRRRFRLVAGQGAFVDDLRDEPAAEVAIVRSTHAHARLVGIDGSAASTAGATLVTASDLGARNGPFPHPTWFPPAEELVRRTAATARPETIRPARGRSRPVRR